MKKIAKVLTTVAAVCLLGGCAKNTGPSTPLVTFIQVTTLPTKTTYYVDEEFDPTGMVVTAKYDDNTTAAVTDYTIADVDTSSVGEKEVVITYQRKMASFTIDVIEQSADVHVESVTLNPKTLSLTVGGSSQTLTATVLPSDATNRSITWTSSDTSIATVANGVVSPVSAGTAVIIVTTVDGGKTDTCTVTVSESGTVVPVSSVTISPSTLNLSVGGNSATLAATVLPENATNRAVNWSIENANPSGCITVNNGVVTPVSAGTATVKVTTVDGNKNATCSVTVTQSGTTVPVTGVSLSPTSLNLTVGGSSSTLTATVAPSNATNRAVNWSVVNANPSGCVTVNNGVVSPVAAGTASVKVTTVDGGFTANCTVTVAAPSPSDVPVTGVSLSPTALNLTVGGSTGTLTATISPSNATNKNVNWSVVNASPAGCVTVSNGTVTPVAAGTATVKVTTVDGNKTATCAVTVTSGGGGGSGVTDTLTVSDTGATSGKTTYVEWDGVKKTSNAVYAGTSAGGFNSIQLRSKNNDSGIVTTTSGGDIYKITVEWNSNTSGRTLDVYGKNSAYSSAEDLFSAGSQGTKIGSISSDSGVELIVSGNYTYVGVCSNSGALYMDSISFQWGQPEPVDPTGISIQSSLDLAAGKSKTLTVSYAPINANRNLGVTWGSSNESVATVSDGKITVKSTATAGQSAVITATSTFNSNFTSSCTVHVVELQKAAWTIMIYMCGSDLESKNGFATSDLNEILSVSNQPDDVNIIIETGGAKKWKMSNPTIANNKLERWHVENKQLIKDDSLPNANMELQSTFQSFLTWGLSEYEAEKTGVIMWDHGGAMQGVCADKNYTYGGITDDVLLAAVDGAFEEVGRTENLEWIGYDACLMGVQDIADLNAKRFNYMVASEELEGGYGWDYDNWLPTLYNGSSTETILTSIVNTFITDGRTSSDETLAWYNLSYADAYRTAWENMAEQLKSKINDGNKSAFATLVTSCKSYGEDDYTDDYLDYCVFDAKDFINKLSSNSTFNPGSTYTNAVLTALDNFIGYNRVGSIAGNSNGVTMFFPAGGYPEVDTYYKESMTRFTNWRYLVTHYSCALA